jgi:thymidylate synthase
MIQEIIARSVGVEVGSYKHCVGSLHLYDANRGQAKRYLAEGWQSSKIAMPPMPYGDPWPDLREVLAAERRIRNGSFKSVPKSITSSYWMDIVHLLRIYERSEAGDTIAVSQLRKLMSTDVFNVYVANRRRRAQKVAAGLSVPTQQ